MYSSRYPQLGDTVDVLSWQGFEPLFFGVPMPWDGQLAAPSPATVTPAAGTVPPAASAPARTGA